MRSSGMAGSATGSPARQPAQRPSCHLTGHVPPWPRGLNPKPLTQRRPAYDTAIRMEGALAADLERIEGQLRESKTLAAGYDLHRDGTAAQRAENRDAKARELDESQQALGKSSEDIQQISDD